MASTIFNTGYRNSHAIPSRLRARSIRAALSRLRRHGLTLDGARLADLPNSSLAGNLYVETPAGRRHYYDGRTQ